MEIFLGITVESEIAKAYLAASRNIVAESESATSNPPDRLYHRSRNRATSAQIHAEKAKSERNSYNAELHADVTTKRVLKKLGLKSGEWYVFKKNTGKTHNRSVAS